MSLEIGEKMTVDGIEFTVHFISREVYTTRLNDKPNKSKERLDLILWRDLTNEEAKGRESPEFIPVQDTAPPSSKL